MRWPGGCFVSSYHWKDAVGEKRQPFFDKAWRMEDPNTPAAVIFVSDAPVFYMVRPLAAVRNPPFCILALGFQVKNELASYEQCMAYTEQADRAVVDVKGLLTALHLEKKIKIAFDEWNLRSWHHPNVHTIQQGVGKDSYLCS